MVLAAASLDDVVAISGFGASLGKMRSMVTALMVSAGVLCLYRHLLINDSLYRIRHRIRDRV